MPFYLSTKNIPQLQHLPLTERLEVMHQAQKKLTGPEKLLLNVLKMCVVIPIFVLILQVATNWLALLWALLVTLLYPAVVKPIQYGLCAKYIQQPKQSGDQ